MTAEPEYPATWTWHGAPKAPGPAVIFDIDGVLADASGRQHHLAGLRRDWDAFFAECGEDPLIPEVARLLELLDARGGWWCCSPRGPPAFARRP